MTTGKAEAKPKPLQEEDTINVSFQLRGAEAADFRLYMTREIIDINSVAGKKLAMERLRAWKQESQAAGS